MRNSIDLRKEMDEMFRDQGHHILLQRTNRKLRCRCWNEIAQEADDKCRICLGKGWLSRMERHIVRSDSAVQIITLPNLNTLTPLGKLYVDAKSFWMRFDSNPQVGDVIYEVGWDSKNTHKPTHIIRCYEINAAYGGRGDRGRIEYWIVSVKGDNVAHQRNIVVRSLGPIKNYEFVGGRPPVT